MLRPHHKRIQFSTKVCQCKRTAHWISVKEIKLQCKRIRLLSRQWRNWRTHSKWYLILQIGIPKIKLPVKIKKKISSIIFSSGYSPEYLSYQANWFYCATQTSHIIRVKEYWWHFLLFTLLNSFPACDYFPHVTVQILYKRGPNTGKGENQLHQVKLNVFLFIFQWDSVKKISHDILSFATQIIAWLIR